MNFLKTLGLGVYYRVRRISKAFKNWKKFGVVIFGAMFLATGMVPSVTLQAQAASTDVLRVTIPVGQATITVGQTEDYTIVSNVKLNGVAVQPDTVKWYVDSAEQTSFRNQQNFTYTPTVANPDTGYLIRVVVTKGSLTANSSSRLYVREGAQQNNLTIAISPAGTQTVAVNAGMQFTPVVKWNNGAAQAGTQVDWYVNSIKKTTLAYTSAYSLPTTTAGVYSVYAVARYNSVTSGHSNSTLVNVQAPTNLTASITATPSLNVAVNQTVALTAHANLNGQDATSTIWQADWKIDGVAQSSHNAVLTFKPTVAKSYAISLTVHVGSENLTASAAATLVANGGSQDVLRVTIPVGAATIKLGQTEDYTIVHNVKLNGVETTPDSVKWYVDGVQKTAYNNQQNFAHTPTAVNTNPGYLIKVVVTKGALTAESTSRLYVQDADKNLAIDIIPVGTVETQINQPVMFTPHVTWNNGAAQAGTQVDWYVNSVKKTTLTYPTQFSFSSTTAGVYSVYAIASYGGVTSNHSNSTLVNVKSVQPETLTVNILEDAQTLTLQNGLAARTFHFAAYHGQNAYTPVQKLWSVIGGGTIDANGNYTTTTASSAVTIKIQVWDEAGQTASDTLTFNVVNPGQDVQQLASVTLVPAVYGPVLSGSAVQYTAYGWDQYGIEIAGNITFTWNLVNGTVGTLTSNQTGYHQATTLNTYSSVVTGTYYPLSATGHFTSTNGTVWNITSSVAQLMLSQVVSQDVLKSVTAVANPASIYVGGDISTLTAQAYGDSGALNSGVSYSWMKISGPSNFITTAYGQSVQIASDTTVGTAVYRVTATYAGDSSSKTADVYVTINPRTSHTLTVNITPDPVYGPTNTDESVRATVLYDSVDVTSLSFLDWTMLNSTAGYLSYENQSYATVRTGNTLGSFANALQVYATYNGMSAYDMATVTVSNQVAPTYLLNWSLNGVIEDGSTPSEGDVIVYTLTLTNNQTTTLNNVQASVEVPTHTTFLSATSAVDHPSLYGRTVSWDAGQFVPGASKTMTIRVTINSKLPKRGVSITAYGSVSANEIAGFKINSNTIRVGAGSGTTPSEPLPSTGTDAIVLSILAAVSLGLAWMTYRWMVRRVAKQF